MILPREEVKELLRFGSLEAITSRSAVVDSVQAIQQAVGWPALGRIRVLDCWPHRNGGYVVRIKLEERLRPQAPRKRPRRDTVRLMKFGHGTTTDPEAAWRDKTVPVQDWDENLGPPPEPEMVDEATEARFAEQAEKRGKVLRAARMAEDQARSQARRLRQIQLTAARKGRSDVLPHFDVIEDELREAERKLDEAA